MYGRFQADNFFVTTITNDQTLVPGQDGIINALELPNIEPGKLFYVIFRVDNVDNRFTLPVYLEDNKMKYKGYNVKSQVELKAYDTISLNDLAENFNYLFKNIDDIGTIVKKGGLDILVYGGIIIKGGINIEIADASITLTDNTTQYIVFDYSDGTLKAVNELDNLFHYCFAEVTTFGGEVTNIVLKKSFNGGEIFSKTYFERNQSTGAIQLKHGAISKDDIDLSTLTSDDIEEGDENKYFKKSVYDPNNKNADAFNMDNMNEGTVKGSIIKSATAPENPTKGMTWYDTTENILKAYNGSTWESASSTVYHAGEGIGILSGNDYSAMRGPCPEGYHVPTKDEWGDIKNIMDSLSLATGNDWNMYLHIPFAGMRSHVDAGVRYQGNEGYYRTSTPYISDTSYNCYYVILRSDFLNTAATSYTSAGRFIRGFKDHYVTPTSDWTVINGTLGNAGIFRDQTSGLISITSDGNTGYTIMDKNLGATNVYNYGDALTEANMGKMYQWGNNYGFGSMGTISNTSPTQVDASAYGPGNYYESDVFIIGNPNWSSPVNYNLWGGVTGAVEHNNEITNTGVLSVNGQDGHVIIEDNVKAFTLTDVDSAQAALNRHLAGKTAILVQNDKRYTFTFRSVQGSEIFYNFTSDFKFLESVSSSDFEGEASAIDDNGPAIVCDASNDGVVTRIIENSYVSPNQLGNYLDVNTNYSDPYQPKYPGSPATKKYVDDQIEDNKYIAGEGIELSFPTRGPAPEGFHTPTSDEYSELISIIKANHVADADIGNFLKNYLLMPLNDYRIGSSGAENGHGWNGYYWCSNATHDATYVDNAYCIHFVDSNSSDSSVRISTMEKAYGLSLRCFKDVPVSATGGHVNPETGWTRLAAGVYHNADKGLISITRNNQDWITIADKNLGATQVYNSGDALSQANCGGYYQRGNNYMFPYTGTVTTSSTKVDGSIYGPGRYYYNSTYITGGDWSSVENDNLWGGETGVQHSVINALANNTKTFTLASDSDLTTAQDILDWYLAGKNPIVLYGGETYNVHSYTISTLSLVSTFPGTLDVSTYSIGKFNCLNFSITDGKVTLIGTLSFRNTTPQVLATNVDYNVPYQPQYNGSPATKKYVDDAIIDNTYTAGKDIEIVTDDYRAMRGPCPEGFHIPTQNEFIILKDALTALGIDTSNGNCMKTYLKMPYAGNRSNSSSDVRYLGEDGWYWSCISPASIGAKLLRIYMNGVNTDYTASPADADSIRGFKDLPVVPNATWTTLYNGSSVATGAGIFHDTTNGLISISSDGANWITIQDKNLGATIVYNDGDNLTQDNCGNYYQRGNCYGFPFTGTVTTSSTKVDASGYGPGNYYSSSTFITPSSSPYSRMSVYNPNLWGGVTGVQHNIINNLNNTKTFVLNSFSDLTTGQAILDWYFAGKNPIIEKDNFIYTLYYYSRNSKILQFIKNTPEIVVSNGMSESRFPIITIGFGMRKNIANISDGYYKAPIASFLQTGVNYTVPYTPEYDGSPATKKYVDDNDTVRKFDLSGTGSTTAVLEEAQAIYDWYNLGKNPLIVYNNYTYVLSNVTAGRLEFRGKLSIENQNSSSYTRQDELYINFASDAVTSVDSGVVSVGGSYLRLGQNYNTPYIPQYDGEPATKKYTDEHGPSIPVYTAHGSITGSKTFTVSVPGTYGIILTGVRAGITNRNITISADGVTVATYTAAYAGLVNAHTILTANSSIGITLDTELTISDIIIEKINVQTGYISES